MPRPQPPEQGPYRGRFPKKQLDLFGKLFRNSKGRHRKGDPGDGKKPETGGGGYRYPR
jgi:hypothetical protein